MIALVYELNLHKTSVALSEGISHRSIMDLQENFRQKITHTGYTHSNVTIAIKNPRGNLCEKKYRSLPKQSLDTV